MSTGNSAVSALLWDMEEGEEEGLALFLGQRKTADPGQKLWEDTGLIIRKSALTGLAASY